MINEFQQKIYNSFLKYSRKGQPFKYRKNFDNISSDIKFYLTRLEIFFKQFPSIDINDYFLAPYEILDKDGYYDLKFYNTMKSKSCYTTFIKNKRLTNDITLDEIKQNLLFLANFCKNNHIQISDYLNFKENINYSFLKHLKENKIHLYILLALPNFEKVFNKIDNDVLNLMFGDLFNNINILRTNFYNSKYKDTIKIAINKLIKTTILYK